MENVFVFNWKIENFTYCLLPTGEVVCSPVFVADTLYRTHWRLKLYPKGLHNPSFVSCLLECHSHNEHRERRVDFRISILDANSIPVVVQTLENIRFANSWVAGFPELLSWDTLKNNRRQYLSKGVLSLQCYLRAVPPPDPADEALLKLSQTFKKLYLNREFTDLTLQTGKEAFPVHRELLCARAPTCSRKLALMNSRHRKTPKYRSKITVGHIPAITLKAFLLYLYCGVMETTDAENWNRLYELSERYELFDMQRDIFPTPTVSSFRTRVQRMTKSIVFSIKNFCSAKMSYLGSLIDLGFARVGVEYFNNDDLPGVDRVGFLIWCFVDDTNATEQLFCTVSALDVDGVPHYSSMHVIEYDAAVKAFVLPPNILREWVLNDSFLSCETLCMRFKFTVVSGLEPVKIETMKTGRALCLGREPPSYLTLSRLSKDLEQLVERDTIATINPKQMKHEADFLQKAILSAWSPVCARLFHDIQHEHIPICAPNVETDIGGLVFQFMCTGRIAIPSFKIASDLYSVARVYRIDCLRQISLRNMTSKLAKDNVIDALIFAHTYDEEEFYTYSQDFVCNYKDEIFCTEEWNRLSRSYPYIVKNTLTLLCSS